MCIRRFVSVGRLVVVLPLSLAACESAPDGPIVTRTDSAGILITTARAPQWSRSGGWKISRQPVVEIGGVTDTGNPQLNGVAGAVRMGNGDIVIGERESRELRRFGADGTLVWRAGGNGAGPGEHRWLGFLGVLADDSLVTYDNTMLRVNIFDPDGRLGRVMRLADIPQGFHLGVIGLSGRLLVMTMLDQRQETAAGAVRWPELRIVSYSLDDGVFRRLVNVPGPESILGPLRRELTYSEYLFAKGPRFALSTGRFALVDTERFSIRSISLHDGATTRILRRVEPPRQVTEDDVEAFVDWMYTRNVSSANMSAQEAEARKSFWRNWPMASSTVPVLNSMYLDTVGNLWVEPHTRHGAPFPHFEVYSSDGTWLGNIAVPSARSLLRSSQKLFDIGDDYILGVWRDERDLEWVRVYSIKK